MRAAVAIFIAVMSCAIVCRADTGAGHVKVDLLADTTNVQDGQPFVLAVRFRIDPGWHIYWTNPGDSGLPTRVKMDVPEGFIAGPVRYPVPTVLRLPGGLVDYGYAGDAVLLVPITPPKPFGMWGPSDQLAFVAHADFLVCRENCLPGKATARTWLGRSTTAAPSHQDLFRLATACLPRDLGTVASRYESTRRPVPAGVSGHVVTRWLAAVGADAKAIEWIPPAIDGYEFADVRVATAAGETTVDYTLTRAGTDPLPAEADGLLVQTRRDGSRIGYALPLFPATQHKLIDFQSGPDGSMHAGSTPTSSNRSVQ